MTIKLDESITGFSIVKKEESAPQKEPDIERMHESVKRPELLLGSTYKIRTPHSEHAFYVTINDIVLNQGTEHEARRPFEMFINSKNMDQFQWVVALTRVVSAVFRKGGDITFLVEELKAVFDPHGGYFKSGGKYMPSIVAEIGSALEEHMQSIGLIESQSVSEAQVEMINQKKEQASSENGYPTEAAQCGKCHQYSLVQMDGCATCLNCGDSKCQ